MRFTNFNTDKVKDKVEVSKQQQQQSNLVLQNQIKPHKNHILFEFNIKTKVISLAVFEPEIKDIHWSQAVNGNLKKKNKKVIKKESCLYISALNLQNCIEILKRDYNINLKNF